MHNRAKDKYLQATQRVLDESKRESEPYEVEVLGEKFIVFPNVFSPKYFHDTAIFAEHLPVKVGDELLEIGPGTGAISITALYRGASRVVAVDINPDAVKNVEENIRLHHMESEAEVRLGNVYGPIKVGEIFDIIFWNTPFGWIENESIPDLEKAVFDPNYKSTERFINDSDKFLKPDGRLYVGFSSTLGDLSLLKEFCAKANRRLSLIYEEESEEVHPVKFEIFEAIKS